MSELGYWIGGIVAWSLAFLWLWWRISETRASRMGPSSEMERVVLELLERDEHPATELRMTPWDYGVWRDGDDMRSKRVRSAERRLRQRRKVERERRRLDAYWDRQIGDGE